MNRNSLIKHIELHIHKAGSINALAKRININVGSLSTIMRGIYGANEEHMLKKIAIALNYKDRDWKTVKTITNYRVVENVLWDARQESMWFAISNPAGSGKTEALEDLFNEDSSGAIIFIQAEEWTGRQFIMKLLEKTCGLEEKGYQTISNMIQKFTEYMLENAKYKPALIIDEADKLKPSALRTLIPIYNQTEHRMGCVMSGTENLQKEIKKGVDYNKKGYDEIDSRLGRNFISLPGVSEREVNDICRANGIKDEGMVSEIWFELEKREVEIETKKDGHIKYKKVALCQDLRRVMRVIKRSRIKTAA